MNKALAEIIAGLIPHKMTRNRFRGILRFGPIRALRLRRSLRRDQSQPSTFLALCAIAKNEGPYFKEWIEWHRSKGVDRFYIYDNGSSDNTRAILQPYIDSGIVEYHYFPGHRRQLDAYDHCLNLHRLDTRWLAFIDLDELIVPVADSSIPQFLQRCDNAPCVELNWLVYGSNGLRDITPGTQMQRFTRHSLPDHPLNRHVKSIINPRRVFNMIGCHEAARINGRALDSHLQPITANFRQRTPQQDIIHINHYAVRSLQEFTQKQARGRASGTQSAINLDYFHRFNLNDIPD